MYVPPPQLDPDARDLRIGMAISRYHADITDALGEAAVLAFTEAGGARENLLIVAAAGAFELVALCGALVHRDDIDGALAIGCVIRGETRHDEYICQAVSQGIMQLTVRTGKPVAFGVLTCGTMHEARARAGGEKGNKGEQAMVALIESVRTVRDVRGVKEMP